MSNTEITALAEARYAKLNTNVHHITNMAKRYIDGYTDMMVRSAFMQSFNQTELEIWMEINRINEEKKGA